VGGGTVAVATGAVGRAVAGGDGSGVAGAGGGTAVLALVIKMAATKATETRMFQRSRPQYQ